MIHILLHFLVPLIVARVGYSETWLRAWAVMLLGLLIDLDHLLADPIYDPDRCSIGFHPLHTTGPILLYLILLIPRQTRWLAIGLCIHIALDALDCLI